MSSHSNSCPDFKEAKNPLIIYKQHADFIEEKRNLNTTEIMEWIKPQEYIDSVTPLLRVKGKLPVAFNNRGTILKKKHEYCDCSWK